MQSDRELMQQALEAMGTVGADWICEASHHAKKDQHQWGEICPLQQRWHIAFQALRERLAQPEQYQRPQMRCATREEKIDKPGVYWVPVEQEPKHDYRTRYDRGCYKCGSHYCPADCPEPAHLVSQQQNTIANSEAIPEQVSEQKPVAWQWLDTGTFRKSLPASAEPGAWRPLYTAPQPNTIANSEAIPEQISEPEQEPVAHSIVAGALFDFMGWLTTRSERLVLSSTDDAAPAADAIKDFAKMRGLSLNSAQVQKWQEHLTAPPRREWVGLTEEDIKAMPQWFPSHETAAVMPLIRAIEAKLKEKNA